MSNMRNITVSLAGVWRKIEAFAAPQDQGLNWRFGRFISGYCPQNSWIAIKPGEHSGFGAKPYDFGFRVSHIRYLNSDVQFSASPLRAVNPYVPYFDSGAMGRDEIFSKFIDTSFQMESLPKAYAAKKEGENRKESVSKTEFPKPFGKGLLLFGSLGLLFVAFNLNFAGYRHIDTGRKRYGKFLFLMAILLAFVAVFGVLFGWGFVS